MSFPASLALGVLLVAAATRKASAGFGPDLTTSYGSCTTIATSTTTQAQAPHVGGATTIDYDRTNGDVLVIRLDFTTPSSFVAYEDLVLLGATVDCGGFFTGTRAGGNLFWGVQCNGNGSPAAVDIPHPPLLTNTRYNLEVTYDRVSGKTQMFLDGGGYSTAHVATFSGTFISLTGYTSWGYGSHTTGAEPWRGTFHEGAVYYCTPKPQGCPCCAETKGFMNTPGDPTQSCSPPLQPLLTSGVVNHPTEGTTWGRNTISYWELVVKSPAAVGSVTEHQSICATAGKSMPANAYPDGSARAYTCNAGITGDRLSSNEQAMHLYQTALKNLGVTASNILLFHGYASGMDYCWAHEYTPGSMMAFSDDPYATTPCGKGWVNGRSINPKLKGERLV